MSKPRVFEKTPHTIRELAMNQLHALSLGQVTLEQQPYAAMILEQYTKHLMVERVYEPIKQTG